MKALWKSVGNSLQFCDLDEPIVTEPDDVKIKVSCSTIGLEDLRIKREGEIHAQSGVAGYEMVGVITDLGEQAALDGFFVGQRVTGTPLLFCGQCVYCRQNKQQNCVSPRHGNGTLAEYIVWKSRQLVRVDDSLGDRQACLIEPVATVVAAMERLYIPIGSSVCIWGADFCGLVMLQLLQSKRVASITVVDEVPYRRELARKFGANHVFDPREDKFAIALYKLTNFNGFDIIIDTSGNANMLNVSQDLIARGGVLMLTSYYEYGRMVSANSMNLIMNNITICGSFLYNTDMLELAARLMPRLQLEELVGKEYPFSRAQETFEEKAFLSHPRVLVKF